jgi:hypothetical protein
VVAGRVVHRRVAEAFGLDHVPLEKALQGAA